MKGKLLLIPALALSLGALALSVPLTQNALPTHAATFLEGSETDEFGQGISAEKYDVVGDEGNKFNFVDKGGSVTFGGFDYNVGFFRTKEKVEVGEGQSLVVEFQTLELGAGYLCLGKGSDSFNGSWGDMVMMQLAGNMVTTAGSGDPFDMTGTQTLWIGTNGYAAKGHYRFAFHADGSAELFGRTDGTDASAFVKICYWNAGAFKNVGSGYVSFMGNGLTGDVSLDNIKVGVASSKELSDIRYSIEEGFEGEECAFVNDPSYAVANSHCKINAPAKYLVMDSPAAGSGIITKKSYVLSENSSKVFDATLKLSIDSLGSKALGLGAGIQENDAPNGKIFLGVREGAAGPEMVLALNGEEVGSVALSETSIDGSVIELRLSLTKEGEGFKAEGQCLGKSLAHPCDFGEGKLAIASFGEGESVAKIQKLSISSFRGVLENGRDLHPTFEKGFDHNWYVASSNNEGVAEEGHVYLTSDHQVRFENAGDGSLLSTKQKYANFDLTFTCRKQQFEEDDDTGAITQASTWIGVSMGREEIHEGFALPTNNLIYFNVDTVDSLPASDRGWCGPDTLMLSEANKGVMMKVHIQAIDGTVKTWLTHPDKEEGAPILTRYNWDTAGYLSFCSTAGGNFWLDDIHLVNLDGGQKNNVAPVASDYSFEVDAGTTLTQKVEASDEDEGELLTYELVEDATSSAGTLSFHEDGTFSFEAKEEAKNGVVTFTYKAFDSESYSETKTVTLSIKEKEIPSSSEEIASEEPSSEAPSSKEPSSTSEAPVTPSSSIAPSSSETPAPDKGNKGGCGGAIVGTSVAALAALAGVSVLALKRRKK